MKRQHETEPLVVDQANRLKQWMNDMPRVLAHIVEEYTDYANWMINRFSPGDWDKLCPMLTFGHEHSRYGLDLASRDTKEMHTMSPCVLAAHLEDMGQGHLWNSVPLCSCHSPLYILDYVSCGGNWKERFGYLEFVLCKQGHMTFYHEDSDRKTPLTSDQYVILREMEHRISILTKQQATGLEPVRHLVDPIEKDAIALRNAWYPPTP